MKYDHIIHTELYSQEAFDMLDALIGQMSDGYWENSPRMEAYWRFSKIQRATDNEVLICVASASGEYDSSRYNPHWQRNGFYDKSDSEILAFFATHLKTIAYADIKDNNLSGWKRDATDELCYLNRKIPITIAHAYALYDYLLGRKSRTSIDIISTPASPEDTAKEQARRDKKAEIDAKYKAQLNQLEEQFKADLKKLEESKNTARHQIYQAWNTDVAAVA